MKTYEDLMKELEDINKGIYKQEETKTYTLGIDPSLTSTGWTVRESGNVIGLGKITTSRNSKIEQIIDEDNRVNYICDELLSIAKAYNISQVKMENQFINKGKGNKNTIGGVLGIIKLKGAIVRTFNFMRCNIIYHEPSVVKKSITGKGNAKKEEVADMIIKVFANNDLVQGIGPFDDGNSKKTKTSDIYDAIAIAFTDDLSEGDLHERIYKSS